MPEQFKPESLKIFEAAPPLKGAALTRALEDLSREKGISPETVAGFLAVETHKEGLTKLQKFAPAFFFAAYLLLGMARNAYPESLPLFDIPLPDKIHAALQFMHSFTVHAAKSEALRDHLPFLALEASLLTGAGALKGLFSLNRRKERIEKTQKEVKPAVEEGRMQYKMKEGHTAAFVGCGDYLADLLQNELPPSEMMTYASAPLGMRAWETIKNAGNEEGLFETFDRGDFASAGEVMMFPVKKEDMFLPGETGHDMTIDEIKTHIAIIDRYCEKRKIPHKPVIIIGSEALSETYITTDQNGKQKTEVITLGEFAGDLKKERDAKVVIVDPTRLVMERIIYIAKGRPLSFHSTGEGSGRYNAMFWKVLEEHKYQSDLRQSEVTIHYNISDIPTTGKHPGVEPSTEIAVILDPQMKTVLMKKGVPIDQIIIVPELVRDELKIIARGR